MSETAGSGSANETGRILRLIGHSLRNKLGVMKNSVYYLRLKVGESDPKVSRHLGLLDREIAEANRTIVNMMDWVSPKEPLRGPLDVSALVGAVIDSLDGLTRAQVVCHVEERMPPLFADEQQIARALENIIAFQSQELGSGDELTVRARASANVRIDCIRSGAGYSSDESRQLFDPDQTDGLSSLRLGLNIARLLARLNGGDVEAESREGIGTRISLILPAAPGQEDRYRAATTQG